MKTAIYGAGNGGKMIFSELVKAGEVVDFFIDEFISCSEICGRPVLRLADIEDKTSVTLLNSLPDDHFYGDDRSVLLIDALRAMGFSKVLTWSDFTWDYPGLFHFVFSKKIREGRDGWRAYAHPEEAEIRKLRALLCDDASLQVLDAILEFRRNPETPLTGLPDQYPAYFPLGIDLFRNMKTLRLADCGAYTGDTVIDAVKYSKVDISYIVSFEPDLFNFSKLSSTMARFRAEYPATDFWAYPSGLWSKCDILQFNSMGSVEDKGDGKVSALVGAPNHDPRQGMLVSVPVVPLDDIMAGAPPNFIKMDIEGAEIEALSGARKLIEACRPTLAISVYHSPDDLWSIPKKIMDVCGDYDFFLRHHSPLLWDTVLYCVARGGAA